MGSATNENKEITPSEEKKKETGGSKLRKFLFGPGMLVLLVGALVIFSVIYTLVYRLIK